MPLFRQPEPLVTVEFKDAALRMALQTVLDSVKGQYVIEPGVSGIVTLRRTQLPLRKMLNHILEQAISTCEVVEENGLFRIRSQALNQNNLAQLQKQIAQVETNARKKMATLPPGMVLCRMSGYVRANTNNQLQSVLEIGAPPSSGGIAETLSNVAVIPQQKVGVSYELTVVRVTERDVLLRSEDGQSIRAPLADFRFYQP